ncbi:MAG: DUF58 domain-containing protein [Bradymonadia bacterium]
MFLLIFLQSTVLLYALVAENYAFAEFLLPLIVAELLFLLFSFSLAIFLQRGMRERRIYVQVSFAEDFGVASESGELRLRVFNEGILGLRRCSLYADCNGGMHFELEDVGEFNLGRRSYVELSEKALFLQSGYASIYGVRLACLDFTQCFSVVDYLFINKSIAVVVRPRSNARRLREKMHLPRRAHSLYKSSETERIRDYVAGDSPRHIAWKLSAHRGKEMLRVQQNLSHSQTDILLDVSQSMRASGNDLLDRALALVLALARTSLGSLSLQCYDDVVLESVATCGQKRFMQRMRSIIPKLRNRYDYAHCALSKEELAREIAHLMLRYDKLDFFMPKDEVDLHGLERYCGLVFSDSKEPLMAAARYYKIALTYRSPEQAMFGLASMLEALPQKNTEHSIVIISSLSQRSLGRDTLAMIKRWQKQRAQIVVFCFSFEEPEKELDQLFSRRQQRRNVALLEEAGVRVLREGS